MTHDENSPEQRRFKFQEDLDFLAIKLSEARDECIFLSQAAEEIGHNHLSVQLLDLRALVAIALREANSMRETF